MYIELKGKRDNENRKEIQEFYDSFEDLFKNKQGKILVRDGFKSGDKREYILEKFNHS